MKHLLNRKSLELLLEQAIFSIFNFLIVINLYKYISTIEIAAIGVNLTALYAAVSISRNLISGEFTQSKFPFSTLKIQDTLRMAALRGLSVLPFVSVIMWISCLFTKTDFETTVLMLLISIEVIFVDNFRQIQILYQRFNFMILSLIASILSTLLVVPLIGKKHNLTLLFWLSAFFFYLVLIIMKYGLYSTKNSQNELTGLNFVSRKSITLESFSNHSLFYLYNLVFFQFNPFLAGEVRLITAWVVNSASSLYITLNNFYSIKLVNYDSNLKEQKSINLLAFITLSFTGIVFYRFHHLLPVGNIKIDVWLIFGVCASSVAFFIHSRISILYLHGLHSSKFLLHRFLTWFVLLSFQLIGTLFFTKNGFIAGSVLSLVYVLSVYNKALLHTTLLR